MTLIELKAAVLFLFSSIETELFRVEMPLPTPRNGHQANFIKNVVKQTGCSVSARRWQAPFNSEQSRFDE